MQAKFQPVMDPPAFQPCELTVRFDTQEELDQFGSALLFWSMLPDVAYACRTCESPRLDMPDNLLRILHSNGVRSGGSWDYAFYRFLRSMLADPSMMPEHPRRPSDG